MSDPEKPDKPLPDTTKFDSPPKWAIDMFGRVHENINGIEARINTRLDGQDGKLDACISGLKTVNGDLEDVKKEFHEFRGATNARLDSNSMRAQTESVHDKEQDDKLAQLSESQMGQLLKAAAKTPMGQKVTNGIVLLVLAALSYGTWWLSNHPHQQPAQPAIQVSK